MKRYIRPFCDVIVLAGFIHLAISLILIIKNSDISYWNVFYIISASDLFPGIEKGLLSTILSLVIVGSAYLYFFFKRNSGDKK